MAKSNNRNEAEISEDKPKFPKHIIDLADYIFANPEIKVSEVVSEYSVKFRKSGRMIEMWLKKAREYNTERIQLQEKIRNKLLIAETKEAVKLDLMTRNEAINILTLIARGKARKGNDNSIIPTDSERIRAIERLSKMDGWDMPNKTELTGANGKDLMPSISVEIINKAEQVDAAAED